MVFTKEIKDVRITELPPYKNYKKVLVEAWGCHVELFVDDPTPLVGEYPKATLTARMYNAGKFQLGVEVE